MPSQMGIASITVSHYCFDRACFSSLSALIYRRHMMHHDTAEQEDEADRVLGRVKDCMVFTPCANHDAQNALKWSLQPYSSKEVLRDLFIYIESLRNGYEHLVRGVAYSCRKQCVSNGPRSTKLMRMSQTCGINSAPMPTRSVS
eukprot:6457407-Amphidinium_carterae.1